MSDLASSLKLHAYFERVVITGDKRMDKWTLQHLLFSLWWLEASEDTRADWTFLILLFPEHTYSVNAAWVLGATQTIRVSYRTDLSSVDAASPWWLCCLWPWRNSTWCRDRYLPCPAQPAMSSSRAAPAKNFPVQCIPRSCSNTTTPYFLWGFLKISSNLLSPITQHHPCNHMPDKHFSARCLSTPAG